MTLPEDEGMGTNTNQVLIFLIGCGNELVLYSASIKAGFVIRLEVVLTPWLKPHAAEFASQLLHLTVVLVLFYIVA